MGHEIYNIYSGVVMGAILFVFILMISILTFILLCLALFARDDFFNRHLYKNEYNPEKKSGKIFCLWFYRIWASLVTSTAFLILIKSLTNWN
jgi:uncharacterized membrane protein YdfJ with MMPL/SSD domain